jgi:hypothetical protein
MVDGEGLAGGKPTLNARKCLSNLVNFICRAMKLTKLDPVIGFTNAACGDPGPTGTSGYNNHMT